MVKETLVFDDSHVKDPCVTLSSLTNEPPMRDNWVMKIIVRVVPVAMAMDLNKGAAYTYIIACIASHFQRKG